MFKSITAAIVIAIATLVPLQEANAAWQRWDGMWVSNVCRAPSGTFWIYPPANAQPVGSYCRIYATGEPGFVTEY